MRTKLVFLFIAFSVSSQLFAVVLYSEFVKDSFTISVDLPQGYSPKDNSCSVVFYMDADRHLGMGMTTVKAQHRDEAKFDHVIFVGVGHIGEWHKKRCRDFIPPLMKKGKFIESKNPNDRHADRFYQFLTLEIFPYINKNYPNNGKFSYIGHSYSGLFGFYCLFHEQPVFTNYIIISPSLWENSNNFFTIEKNFYNPDRKFNANVYHFCGKREWGNLVLSTSRKMKKILQKRNYPGLNYTYQEIKGKTHLGMVQPGLDWVFKNIQF